MKKDTFLKLLSNIDDDLIEEAETPVRKKHKMFRKYMATAACLCIVLAGCVIGAYVEKGQQKKAEESKTYEVNTNKIAKMVTEPTEKNVQNKKIKSTDDKSSNHQDSVNTEDKKAVNSEENIAEKTTESDLYRGNGTGEFIYNNKTYCIVNRLKYLKANNLPVQVHESDIGTKLADNVSDTEQNNIGSLYKYKKIKNETILIVQGTDGVYSIAIEK